MNDFNKDKYFVFGLGATGKSVIKFLQKKDSDVFVGNDNIYELQKINVDDKQKIFELNDKVFTTTLKDVKYISVSPSIHLQYKPHKILKFAKKYNKIIVSPTDIFCNYLSTLRDKNKSKLICITGTNGKSTATALTTYLINNLKLADKKDKHNTFKAICCENFGYPITDFDANEYDYFVCEMSSYRLFASNNSNLDFSNKNSSILNQFKDNFTHFEIGVLNNITEDHLAYHKTMKNYSNSKAKGLLLSNKKILCVDDRYTKKIAKDFDKQHIEYVKISTKKVLKDKNSLSWRSNIFYKDGKEIFEYEYTNLKGIHNIENILCAVACVYYGLNFDKDDIKENKLIELFKMVKNFVGLKHRIQFVKEIDGIEFINDSKGTNAISPQKALNSYPNDDIYLIAGGQRKTAGFLTIKNDLKNVKCVFLIGEASDSFANELDSLNIKYIKCITMEKSVKKAFEIAKKDAKNCKTNKKKIVLLSPLCASWDQYKSFEERGDDFINIVNNLC